MFGANPRWDPCTLPSEFKVMNTSEPSTINPKPRTLVQIVRGVAADAFVRMCGLCAYVMCGLCAYAVCLCAFVRSTYLLWQVMNTSFGSWRLVNTYGAFGSITREREEVIIQVHFRPRTLPGHRPCTF